MHINFIKYIKIFKTLKIRGFKFASVEKKLQIKKKNGMHFLHQVEKLILRTLQGFFKFINCNQ